MSESTVTQQIATLLNSVYAEIAKFTARYGGGLTENLNVNEYEIIGPAEDGDGNIPPVRIRTAGMIELLGAQVRLPHVETPQVVFNALPSTLGPLHDGMHFYYDAAMTFALALDSDIPTPDVESGGRWTVMIHNESLTETAAIEVTAGAVTINGGTTAVEIEPLSSRILTRKDSGFQVQ